MRILVGIIPFFFKSGFAPCADIVHKIFAMQTIGQVVGKRLTTLILHEVPITKWEDRSSVDDWKRFDVSFDDLC